MSNDRQLKAIFAPFLKAHPEARYHNGRIFLRPLSQVAWALTLRTSRAPDSFSVMWGASEMFIPDAPVWPFDHSVFPEGGWILSREGIAEALWRATEEQCLAHIPEMPTLDDLYHFGINRHDPSHPNFYDVNTVYGSFYHAAKGNMEQAIALSTKLVAATTERPIEKLDLKARVVIRDLHPLLLADDRRGIGALLRQMEQRCVISHRMEKFWEPAPYPVELQA